LAQCPNLFSHTMYGFMAAADGAFSFRTMILVLLCTQNSLYTLLRRYSRGVLQESVSPSAVLLAAELLKFVISSVLVENKDTTLHGLSAGARQGGPVKAWLSDRTRAVKREVKSSCAMAVPAVTYLIMNLLSFKAIALVDATVFAMIAQLKILSTAGFSLTVLGRRLSTQQWRAIYVLTLAVTMITYQKGSGGASGTAGAALSSSYVLGVCMVLLEITLSGWISAYFEKYLKDGQSSVWGRNLQLSFWSILIYGVIEACQQTVFALPAQQPTLRQGDDPQVLVEANQMPGSSAVIGMVWSVLRLWSPVTIMLVILGGGGGLLVAFAIKHADAVMKSMATAFSLVIVVLAEMMFLGVPADPIVCLAGGVALLGLQGYQDAPKFEQAKQAEDRGASVQEERAASKSSVPTAAAVGGQSAKGLPMDGSTSGRPPSEV